MVTRNLVSVRDLLEVVDEFERLEPDGVSVALASWELLAPELVVTSAMRLASAHGMVEETGWDPRVGGPVWRLTELGRERLAAAPGVGQLERCGSITHLRALPPDELASAAGSSSSEIRAPSSVSQLS